MDNRTHVVVVKVTRSERELIESAIGHTGETFASFVRRATIPLARRVAQQAERVRREPEKIPA